MDKNIKNVTVIGAGYVGLSLSLALSKYYDVTIIEIDSKSAKTNWQKTDIKNHSYNINI